MEFGRSIFAHLTNIEWHNPAIGTLAVCESRGTAFRTLCRFGDKALPYPGSGLYLTGNYEVDIDGFLMNVHSQVIRLPVEPRFLGQFLSHALRIDGSLALELAEKHGAAFWELVRQRPEVFENWLSPENIEHCQTIHHIYCPMDTDPGRLRIEGVSPLQLDRIRLALGDSTDLAEAINNNPFLLYLYGRDITFPAMLDLALDHGFRRNSVHALRAAVVALVRRHLLALGATAIPVDAILPELHKITGTQLTREKLLDLARDIDSRLLTCRENYLCLPEYEKAEMSLQTEITARFDTGSTPEILPVDPDCIARTFDIPAHRELFTTLLGQKLTLISASRCDVVDRFTALTTRLVAEAHGDVLVILPTASSPSRQSRLRGNRDVPVLTCDNVLERIRSRDRSLQLNGGSVEADLVVILDLQWFTPQTLASLLSSISLTTRIALITTGNASETSGNVATDIGRVTATIPLEEPPLEPPEPGLTKERRLCTLAVPWPRVVDSLQTIIARLSKAFGLCPRNDIQVAVVDHKQRTPRALEMREQLRSQLLSHISPLKYADRDWYPGEDLMVTRHLDEILPQPGTRVTVRNVGEEGVLVCSEENHEYLLKGEQLLRLSQSSARSVHAIPPGSAVVVICCAAPDSEGRPLPISGTLLTHIESLSTRQSLLIGEFALDGRGEDPRPSRPTVWSLQPPHRGEASAA